MFTTYKIHIKITSNFTFIWLNGQHFASNIANFVDLIEITEAKREKRIIYTFLAVILKHYKFKKKF
jgi:hypothetical protein